MIPPDLLTEVTAAGRTFRVLDLRRAEGAGLDGVGTAPRTSVLLAENAYRTAAADGPDAALAAARAVLAPAGTGVGAYALRPNRLLLQDHSGLPVLADVASARESLRAAGEDPSRLDLTLPVELVVDHSVEVRSSGTPAALRLNMAAEFDDNEERFRFLKWATGAFHGLRVVPPGHGIVHQVHLESLARLVCAGPDGLVVPDFVLGTDSHTPMVNGLGVLGWGVGGVEAVTVALGGTISATRAESVGVRLEGRLRAPAMATDLALTLAHRLRAAGVVGAMVEFFGPGCASLSVPDRATVANMAPEYGSTVAMFPVDERTLEYLRLTDRPEAHVETVAAAHLALGLFGDRPDAVYGRTLTVQLDQIEPTLAGPGRPERTLVLSRVPASLPAAAPAGPADPGRSPGGRIVLAAIASCTNTANTRAMIVAGLLASGAVAAGLRPPEWVKTSLTPGSPAVTEHLRAAGLLEPLERLGFHVAGYGCGTCIGNSGPLLPAAAAAGPPRVAVLSGNRNFDGRIHPEVEAAYLASPPLVVAYALAGEIGRDLTAVPLQAGSPVRLADLWPGEDEVEEAMRVVDARAYGRATAGLFGGDPRWEELAAPDGILYDWPAASTYLRPTPFAVPAFPPAAPIRRARVLVWAPDLTTTDHISPAGSIAPASPAGRYLSGLSVPVPEFGSYGTRRGNHEVLRRGVFANPRFRNQIADRGGPWTVHWPTGEPGSVSEVADRYRAEDTPLIVLAGRNYGTGSSRDWAAKGPALLGVRAVLAVGFERIHRANLVGVGVLPLQFEEGTDADRLGLDGSEEIDILMPAGEPDAAQALIRAVRADGWTAEWPMRIRLDTPAETAVWRAGGSLPRMVALAGFPS